MVFGQTRKISSKILYTIYSSAWNLILKSTLNTYCLIHKKNTLEKWTETNSVVFCGLTVFLFAWSPLAGGFCCFASCRNRQPRPLLRAISTELPTLRSEPRFEILYSIWGGFGIKFPKTLRSPNTSQRKILSKYVAEPTLVDNEDLKQNIPTFRIQSDVSRILWTHNTHTHTHTHRHGENSVNFRIQKPLDFVALQINGNSNTYTPEN